MNDHSPLTANEEDDFEYLGQDSDIYDQDPRGSQPKDALNTKVLFLLTLGTFGLQIGWSVELAEVTPFLLSLGLSKAVLAIVWIAGPLTGTLVQPYVGKWSDNHRSKWGRRRPFCIAGAVGTGLSLLVLSRIQDISAFVLGIFGAESESYGVQLTAQLLAIVLVYVLDFFINLLQAALRAFVVDSTPHHQQDTANAWIARMMNAGNILGYLAGYTDMTVYLSLFGNTQFKILCVFALFTILLTVGVSCYSITEPPTDSSRKPPSPSTQSLVAICKSIIASVRGLSPFVRSICIVQVAAWIGWFPYLFYATTYIAEIHADSEFRSSPNLSDDEIEAVYARGARLGTFALLIAAIVSFATSIIVPLLIPPTYQDPSRARQSRYSSALQNTLEKVRIPGFTLTRAWLASHLLFAALMFLTFVTRSVAGGTAIISAAGISWAVIHWVPYVLVGQQVSSTSTASARNRSPALPASDADADEAGTLLGILNVSIALPQILASLIASGIFHALQKPRGVPGDESVAWVFRFSGVCALGAAWLTRKVAAERERVEG